MADLNSALQVLVGEQLGAVTFVHDYWQLDFGGHVLTEMTRIRVTSDGSRVESGEDRFRDRLCGQIAKTVRTVKLSKDALEIHFSDRTRIEISLRDEDYVGPEALNFHWHTSEKIWVV